MGYVFQTAYVWKDVAGGLPDRGDVQSFVKLGDLTSVLLRAFKPTRLAWKELPFGLPGRDVGQRFRIAHASLERLGDVDRWVMLQTCRCVVPFYGHRPTRGSAFGQVTPGMALGFYDDDREGGFVLVSNGGIGVADPVLVDAEGARAWLEAEQWETMPMLLAAAGRLRAVAEPGI